MRRKAPQEGFNFRTPNLSLRVVSSPHVLERSRQAQNQITRGDFNRHQAECFTSLPLDRIAQ